MTKTINNSLAKLIHLLWNRLFMCLKHLATFLPTSGCFVRGRCLLLAMLCIVSSGVGLIGGRSANADGCDDVRFVFARGSGESLGDVSATAWRDSLESVLSDSELKYGFYELGTSTQGGYRYPAVAVSDSLSGYINMLGAYVGGGAWFEFGASVDQGAGELKSYLSSIASSCPNTKFILGGYSQGAMLISRTLGDLDASKILYVATFGDPKAYLPEGNNQLFGPIPKIPDACQGKNLSPYRAYVPNCYAYEGVLGSYRPYQPEDYSGKLGTWCNNDDIMCSSGLSISDHTAYVSSNLYGDAAHTISSVISRAFGEKLNFGTAITSALHEVAILIDSTGSMSNLIKQYSAEAKKLAERVLRGGGRVSLFEYRDLVDGFLPQQLCDFSCDLEEFNQQISNIQTADGGDDPESALSAILTTMNSLNWTNGATKSLVLLTDAGYHAPDRDGVTLSQVIQRGLEIDPVNIYIMTTSGLQSTYADLAAGTNGEVFNIATGLDLSTDTILGRPVARLNLSEYVGGIGDEFTFDASASYTMDGSALRYDWDLDGDGIFELQDAAATVSQVYPSPQDHYIQVKTTDPSGATSTMSAHLSVLPDSSLALASIDHASSTPLSATSAQINFSTNADQVLLAVDDAILGFVPISDRQGSITLGDLRGSASVTLLPYLNGRRGVSYSLSASPILPKVPNTAVYTPPITSSSDTDTATYMPPAAFNADTDTLTYAPLVSSRTTGNTDVHMQLASSPATTYTVTHTLLASASAAIHINPLASASTPILSIDSTRLILDNATLIFKSTPLILNDVTLTLDASLPSDANDLHIHNDKHRAVTYDDRAPPLMLPSPPPRAKHSKFCADLQPSTSAVQTPGTSF